MNSSDNKRFDDALFDALDEEVAAEAPGETAASLGIDVVQFAGELRQKVADFDAAERRRAWGDAARKRQEELVHLQTESTEDDQLEMAVLLDRLKGLIEEAGPKAAGMHFMKFETPSRDDVLNAIRALTFLLQGDRDEE